MNDLQRPLLNNTGPTVLLPNSEDTLLFVLEIIIQIYIYNDPEWPQKWTS